MAADNSGIFSMLEPFFPPSKKSRKDWNRPGSTPTAEVMDQEIWKELPEELLEAVIARLHIASFFRLRSVCRKWNCLLDSKSFCQYCAQLPQRDPWFYAITHDNKNVAAMYDPSFRKWHHPPISFLPARIAVPVTSAGGLVCFLDMNHRNFHVCNPLTQSSKELAARSVKLWSQVAVAMTLNGSGGYKIMWVGCDGEYEVYDSVKNSWSPPRSMPPNIKLPLSVNLRSHVVSVNSTLYLIRSDPEGIVSYNMVNGVWKQFIIPAPLHMGDHSLAECEGKIMLVGLLTENAGGAITSCVCIWELQKMTFLWKEVDRMPNTWCLEFNGKKLGMTCLGSKGLLMLSLRSTLMNRLFTYNLMSKEWVQVPKCVIPRGRKRQWIAYGTAFHPSLTAFA